MAKTTTKNLWLVKNKNSTAVYTKKSDVPSARFKDAVSLEEFIQNSLESRTERHRLEKAEMLSMLTRQALHIMQQDEELESLEHLRLPKLDRYKTNESDEMDYIDRSLIMQGMEGFRSAIRWTIDKYFDRFGKKDDDLAEARKIFDYAQRFYLKVKEEHERKQEKETLPEI